MKALYAGSDLHSNNNFLGIIDGQGKKIFKKKLLNDPGVVLENLEPFKKKMVGIVVESTYNWYWLVDALMDKGYQVRLANPADDCGLLMGDPLPLILGYFRWHRVHLSFRTGFYEF